MGLECCLTFSVFGPYPVRDESIPDSHSVSLVFISKLLSHLHQDHKGAFHPNKTTLEAVFSSLSLLCYQQYFLLIVCSFIYRMRQKELPDLGN
jgi:hypothetical protein